MNCLTIRGLPDDVAKSLQEEKNRRGKSLNQTVIELLRHALNLEWSARSTNGMEKLAGSWSQKELEHFEREMAIFEHADEEHWK